MGPPNNEMKLRWLTDGGLAAYLGVRRTEPERATIRSGG